MRFFSLKGRLPRRRFFWITVKLLVLFIVVGIVIGIVEGTVAIYTQCPAYYLEDKLSQSALDCVKRLENNTDYMDNFFVSLFAYILSLILCLFPYVKRLHDVNWPISLYLLNGPPMIYDLSLLFLDWEKNWILWAVLTAPSFCLWFLLLVIRGTKGPNAHGPDPLANKTQKSSTL